MSQMRAMSVMSNSLNVNEQLVQKMYNDLQTSIFEAVQDEVKNTLSRMRKKIFEAIDVEDDLDLDENVFAKNTANRVFKSEAIDESMKKILEYMDDHAKCLQKKLMRSLRLKKDPEAPKGAKNAFILFCSDNRDEVKEENPSLTYTEITKKLGEMWKSIDEELKSEYQEKAKDDKERYNRELEDYEPKEGYYNPKEKISKKKLKEIKPKRARSAYIFFCNDKRQEVSKRVNNNKEVLQELGRMWKNLSDKKKQKYNEMAEEDKTRYEEEMKEYNEKHNLDNSDKKSKSKRTPSAYILFCKDKRGDVKEENPELSMGQISSILGKMWKECSKKDKKKYMKKAEKLKKENEEDDHNNDEDSEEDNEDNEDSEDDE